MRTGLWITSRMPFAGTLNFSTFHAQQDDYLFARGYKHLSEGEAVGPCALCLADKSMLVSRPPRGGLLPAVHFGGVASGNQLVKNGLVRSQIAERHPGVFG
jgi:hypothetical protein